VDNGGGDHVVEDTSRQAREEDQASSGAVAGNQGPLAPLADISKLKKLISVVCERLARHGGTLMSTKFVLFMFRIKSVIKRRVNLAAFCEIGGRGVCIGSLRRGGGMGKWAYLFFVQCIMKQEQRTSLTHRMPSAPRHSKRHTVCKTVRIESGYVISVLFAHMVCEL